MPFTFAHPVIVLPLKKVNPDWFSTTGLIVGSIAPDLPYFAIMDAQLNFGHSWIGVFLLDLPLSFLVAIVFHLWIRNNLIMHLPSPLDNKYYDYTKFDFLYSLKQKWLTIAISMIVGVVSHLIWDEFSKPEGLMYYLNPSFFEQTINMGPFSIHLYDLIERTGSIVGLIVMIWIILQKKVSISMPASLSLKKKSAYWGSILLSIIFIVGIKLIADKEENSFGHFVVVLTSAALMALSFTSLIYILLKPGGLNK